MRNLKQKFTVEVGRTAKIKMNELTVPAVSRQNPLKYILNVKKIVCSHRRKTFSNIPREREKRRSFALLQVHLLIRFAHKRLSRVFILQQIKISVFCLSFSLVRIAEPIESLT